MSHGEDVVHDLQSLLSSSRRDYLVRNNGDQIMIDSLKGKKIGLYFGASCGPCERFTPILVEAYNEISHSKSDFGFEIIFVTADKDEEIFHMHFSKMPWLAIPFFDSDTGNHHLHESYKVRGIPHLVVFDENGKLVTESGVEILREHGVEGYPFTLERMKELNEEEEKVRRNESLSSILVSRSRDYVISSCGKKVLVSELQGRTVGLYFSMFSYQLCDDFTPQLVGIYEKLKAKGESFEVVLIPLDDDEELFNQGSKHIPWLSLPFKDKSCEKLAKYFELSTLPTLVIIGPDGKTLQLNVVDAIEEHGIDAYPFTSEKNAELVKIEKAKEQGQALKSILFSGDDYVIGKDDVKIPVTEIMGRIILLYFSLHRCGPSHAFQPKLVKAYHDIKAKDSAFEIIFVSFDNDQASYDEYFAGMPWLAFPFDDPRVLSLGDKFKVNGPMLVAIGPSGQTLTKKGRDLIMMHGADAYPFTRERRQELEAKIKGWPEKVTHGKHEHELVKTRDRHYICDGCDEEGSICSYWCKECDFDLHPKCALEDEEDAMAEAGIGELHR